MNADDFKQEVIRMCMLHVPLPKEDWANEVCSMGICEEYEPNKDNILMATFKVLSKSSLLSQDDRDYYNIVGRAKWTSSTV